MHSKLRFAAASAFVSLGLVAGTADAKPRHDSDRTVEIHTAKGVRRFTVEIAADDASPERGLMFRKSMAKDHGMLFEFEEPAVQTFWMHNTYIPLDIIYIGADGRIVSIAANAAPFDDTPLASKGPAKAVLEIDGGLSQKLGIRPGDRVSHPFLDKR